jgi:predicted RNase H-like HicB family nuclease
MKLNYRHKTRTLEIHMAEFTLEYWEDDGWFVGRVAEVPGVFSQGESLEELKENIQDAYKLMIESETPFSPPHASRISVELDV